MSRRAVVASSIGIVAPICLLAIGVLADRAFHHRHEAAPPVACVPASPLDDLLARIEQSCTGPEGVDDCAPRAFEATFAAELPVLRVNRAEVERRWLADLRARNHVAAYGLAWLRSGRALPLLRSRLLEERYFYGWETSTPYATAGFFADNQFPRHQAYILAIEWIDGRPLRRAVTLTREERLELSLDAADCEGMAASWLLYRLERVPLPLPAISRARYLVGCPGLRAPRDPVSE